MKRIEAMVPNMRRRQVVEGILQAGAKGVTLVESRGKGDGERPMVKGARGTAKYIADYNRIDTIITMVDDSKVDSIVSAIMNTAYRGNEGDGMIFVSTIDEAYKISTKEKISSLS
ncbi:MAG: P-II family nitrogen regulator [Nitrosopumilus sp.]|nr:P-II family nitrogen regulator [Nitrosopumilus sp.]MDF2423385.1 P-II family nitrogen regulator [Nitrosopumilus sp.]MDF2425541.1 P-II family nitrogen regulator [Nitrosopumilus sp.]MDF2426761.1 P-II family nitrogen regulator [Nitrosopumilus sp.]MDF2427998.1 P-II family nitrogen regulator [Nitrosopumilus sp.]